MASLLPVSLLMEHDSISLFTAYRLSRTIARGK
jgi:hypothetical protein